MNTAHRTLYCSVLTGLLLAACQPTETPPASKPDAAETPVTKVAAKANADAGPPDASAKTLADPPKTKRAAPTEILLERPRTQAELRTTKCSIYRGNQRATLEALEKRVKSGKAQVLHRRKLVTSVYSNAHYTADLKGIQRAYDLTTEILKESPDQHATRLLRARIARSLHLSGASQKDIDHVRKKAPETPGLAKAEHEQALMMGDKEAFKKSLVPGKTSISYAKSAHARFATGDLRTAERYYAIAEAKFAGTNPSLLAWLNVQRGLLFMHSGDFPKAKLFFAEAVDRCSDYPLAVEHLAESEHLLGNNARAIELYLKVIKQTSNPEFMAALSDIYASTGEADKAKAMAKQADARNTELLKTFPEALYWHASDFYLGAGNDPAKGLSLLQKNAKNRPSPDQLQPLAEAYLANNDVKSAAKTIKVALDSPLDTAEIRWTAARVALKEGKKEESAKHKARALEFNPKVAVLEGPLTEGEKP